jgi:hypothetical protein
MEMVGGMARREPGKTLRLTRVRIHHLESSVQDQGFRIQDSEGKRRTPNIQRPTPNIERRSELRVIGYPFSVLSCRGIGKL